MGRLTQIEVLQKQQVSWKQVSLEQGWKKLLYGFILVYFTVSIPLHVQTYLTRSTDYIDAFPAWYSAPIAVLLSVMLIFVWRLRYRTAH